MIARRAFGKVALGVLPLAVSRAKINSTIQKCASACPDAAFKVPTLEEGSAS